MIQPLKLNAQPKAEESAATTDNGSWIRAAMFCIASVIILYIQSITRDQQKISEEDLGLVYTLYTCSLLLLVGMSVLWH